MAFFGFGTLWSIPCPLPNFRRFWGPKHWEIRCENNPNFGPSGKWRFLGLGPVRAFRPLPNFRHFCVFGELPVACGLQRALRRMPGDGSESSNPMTSSIKPENNEFFQLRKGDGILTYPLPPADQWDTYQWEKEKVPVTEWRWTGYGQSASAGPYAHSESREPVNQSAYAEPSPHSEPQIVHSTRSRFYRDENA
eukprot:6041023-Amphidinium_carterae.1